MDTAKERAIKEYNELESKAHSLNNFILFSENYKKLSSETQELLELQYHAMKIYLTCLTKRLDSWKDI